MQRCKSHGGPIATAAELQSLTKDLSNESLNKCLRNEIIFRRLLHPNDFASRPSLYKVNKTSTHIMMANLTIMLTSNDDRNTTNCNAAFPGVDQMINVCSSLEHKTTVCDNLFYFRQPIADVWDISEQCSDWNIAFYLHGSSDETNIVVEQLNGNEMYWSRSEEPEVLEISLSQLKQFQ